MTIQDYGVTYDELEPHYDRFEYLCGTSGAAGNLKGQILDGGNPFEGPRSRPYPNPPQAQPFSHTLFAKAARELGYKPFPQPSGNMSQAYVNPLGSGSDLAPIVASANGSDAAIIRRRARRRPFFLFCSGNRTSAYRTECEVTRINVDGSGKRATGVTFVDTSGEELEQPADLVILAAFSIFNVQLLLLSKIGQPYDPVANTGVIGRNFTHQTISQAIGFFDKDKFNFNPFIASGSIGMCIDEFNGDNFDHGPLGFVGGGYMGQVQTNGRPIQTNNVPPGTPRWGAELEERRARQLSEHGDAGYRRARELLLLSRRLSRPRPALPRPIRPSAGAHNDRLPRQRAQAERLSDRQIRRDHQGDGRERGREAILARDHTTSRSTRRRISAAARSWGPTPRPARSTAICKAGTFPTFSSWARAHFRRTPDTIQPARLRRLPTGRPRRSELNTSRTRDRLSMHKATRAPDRDRRGRLVGSSRRAWSQSAARRRTSRDEPRPAELRSDRARAVSDGRGRLRELSHCARLRPALRRRPADRNSVRRRCCGQYHARS